MPEIKVEHVVSFSSEDKNYPAENLLKPEGTSKWRSGSTGEQNVTCILQLEKAVKVSQIDIGNEGAAFVEVLVGRSSGSESDFQVILVASSFMNPTESRNGQNLNRVRIFTSDKLNNAVLDQKWDRVKVVCSQRFNKTTKYGLSFIKLHSPSDGTEPALSKQSTLGAFKLKSDEPAADLKAGSLFANRHKKDDAPQAKPLTGAAAVRAASKEVEKDESQTNGTPSRAANRPEKPAAPSPRPPAAKRKHDDKASGDQAEKPTFRRQSNSTSSVASERSRPETPPPVKKSRSEPTRESPAKPFGRLMKKVVFVLSGFQNPERGDIRDRALEMGATYRPDWGNGCTHLVCAFANTPKFNAVRKRGRIVTKHFINECHKRRKLLPWRKFRLGNAPSPPGSSGSESEDEPAPPSKRTRPETTDEPKRKATEKPRQKSPIPSTSKDLDSDDPAMYEGSTDDEGDTDDDIERVKAATARRDKSPAKAATATPVIELGDTTDENSDGEEDVMTNLPELPSFFSGKRFLLYGQHRAGDKRTLVRFIIAYDGKVEEYMNDQVHYVITNDDWDDNFDDALSENPSLAFVRPNWVLACNDKQKLLPHQKYVVVPRD